MEMETLEDRMKKLARNVALMMAGLCGVAMAQQSAKLADGDRVAILGDSITEQKNYSVLIENYLLACQPAAKLQTAQFGWGGETTWGFAPRMAQDVLWFKPSVATIAYGMNDGGYKPVEDKRLEDYKNSTRDIIRQLKASGTRMIVVGGPGAVDRDSFRTFIAQGREAAEMYNKTLKTFGEAAEQVAKEEGVVFANLHNIMADAMMKFKQLHPDKSFVGNDGIHPDNVGHTVMAYAFLKALGCDGDIGTITADLSQGTGGGTEGHKVLSVSEREVTIESTRYPFQAPKNMDPLSISAAMEVVPFQQELNRFTLKVVPLPVGKTVHVTWSEITSATDNEGRPVKPIVVEGDFTSEQLTAGINLASAFNTTPFEHAWGRLDQAVHAQQDFETPLNKHWLHNQKAWSTQSPEASQQFAELADAGKNFDEKLRAVSGTRVVPVKHTLKFEVR
jgi:lysophospholipase L1-like esterase